MNLQALAMNLMAKNPAIANNPNAQTMLEIINSGDQVRGEQLANNLLETYGVSKEDALQQAKTFFGLPL